ncbi:MAG: flagellar basal body rod protein FlgC [Deltaproteobacteria bacterium]|nr:flagellar basal body rod protein FlgC [Deltaproteobacteria bacterium]
MDFITSFKICGSGLAAQRAKMDVITSNLANVNTTRTDEGGPYKKKNIAFEASEIENHFDATIKDAVKSVEIAGISEDPNPIKMVYDPSHPDADDKGYVAMPNINVISEMVDMITVSRAYEACVTVFDATKNMALKTLDMGN